MLPTNEDAREEKNFVFMNLYFNRLVTQSSEIPRIRHLTYLPSTMFVLLKKFICGEFRDGVRRKYCVQ